MTNLQTAARPRRPRPKIVSLTEAAADRVRELMIDAPDKYLRVGVKNGGCAGMEYVMDYAVEPSTLDEIVEDQGVKIVVDSKAVLFLIGSVVDFVDVVIGTWHFWAFNVADAAITVGVAAMLADMMGINRHAPSTL